ncbi:Hypothetical_protein [Hexamita inflata]|uniref:Hypothetical_protein n=1 Tax=Hexamita inflata TaxID=28002 RepID=A0AA86V1F2_9EUKA|nr:Hypothetical protein HINF_LOCUS60107 [Hexamita inflata]
MNKQTTHWMDLVPLLPQTIVKQNFMVYFCNEIPLIFQNNQILTVSGQILLNDIQRVQYNNLASEISDRKSECIVQQNNQYFVLQLNYDESYQLKVQLSKIENITQPDCLTFSFEIQWEEFLQNTVKNFINTQYKKEEFWNFYTDVVHPGVYICQPVELINIIKEISINSFKNIDNAVKFLKTQSDQLLKIGFFICSQINVFDFIFSYLYEVIIEIFNRSNTSVLQIIKVLFWLNKIDEAIELVNQSQSLQAYEEFLNYLNLTYDNCKLSLAKYQLFISNFYLIFQNNLPNLDFQNIFSTMFVYHLMIYGTEQINISFDPNIKLYIGKHNELYIQDYATQLQVVILSQCYNKYVNYFISQQNEVSHLGLTCFQIAIMGGNTEMIIQFQDQMKIQTFHITSLMLLMTTYQESIPDSILERLIELQAGMISNNKLCALQLLLQQPKQISLKYIKLLLEKEFKLISFNQITEFMTFLSFKQFQYLSQLNFVDGISVSEAILFTIIQHNKMYPAFQFVNIDIKRNTRFRPICAKHLTHDHIKLLFQHFSFSLSHDIAFLNQILSVQTNLKPIHSCLKNNLNLLRGFSCYDFAINFKKVKIINQFKKVIDFAITLMKIPRETDLKRVDYFFKPIVAGDSLDGADVFSRNNQDHTKLFYLANDLWQSE